MAIFFKRHSKFFAFLRINLEFVRIRLLLLFIYHILVSPFSTISVAVVSSIHFHKSVLVMSVSSIVNTNNQGPNFVRDTILWQFHRLFATFQEINYTADGIMRIVRSESFRANIVYSICLKTITLTVEPVPYVYR